MLKIIRTMKKLDFAALMEVYAEGNQENGRDQWPGEPAGQQLLLAEQEFYQYLRECFFPTEGAVYFVWEENGKYASALRLEPYRDGLLLEALETAPAMRRNGYAAALIRAVQSEVPGKKLYSHVSKRNVPSLRTHERCGFHKILDYAVYADGSVMHNHVTLLYESSAAGR